MTFYISVKDATTGKAVEGAAVTFTTFRRGETQSRSGTTGRAGTTAISPYYAGIGTITISRQGYETYTEEDWLAPRERGRASFDLTPTGEAVEEIEAPPVPIKGGFRIVCYYTLGRTAVGLVGVGITVAGRTFTSNSDGIAETGLIFDEGSYSLTASKSGYVTQTKTAKVTSGDLNTIAFYMYPEAEAVTPEEIEVGVIQEVEVPLGAIKEVEELYPLEVWVQDQHRNNVGDATVTINPGGYVLITGSDGRVVEDLYPGTYQVEATKRPGYGLHMRTVEHDAPASGVRLTIEKAVVEVLPLVAVATFDKPGVEVGGSITFSGFAEGGSPPYSYKWEFRKPPETVPFQESLAREVTLTFDKTGLYTAKLVVTDETGKTAPHTIEFTVFEKGKVRIEVHYYTYIEIPGIIGAIPHSLYLDDSDVPLYTGRETPEVTIMDLDPGGHILQAISEDQRVPSSCTVAFDVPEKEYIVVHMVLSGVYDAPVPTAWDAIFLIPPLRVARLGGKGAQMIINALVKLTRQPATKAGANTALRIATREQFRVAVDGFLATEGRYVTRTELMGAVATDAPLMAGLAEGRYVTVILKEGKFIGLTGKEAMAFDKKLFSSLGATWTAAKGAENVAGMAYINGRQVWLAGNKTSIQNFLRNFPDGVDLLAAFEPVAGGGVRAAAMSVQFTGAEARAAIAAASSASQRASLKLIGPRIGQFISDSRTVKWFVRHKMALTTVALIIVFHDVIYWLPSAVLGISSKDRYLKARNSMLGASTLIDDASYSLYTAEKEKDPEMRKILYDSAKTSLIEAARIIDEAYDFMEEHKDETIDWTEIRPEDYDELQKMRRQLTTRLTEMANRLEVAAGSGYLTADDVDLIEEFLGVRYDPPEWAAVPAPPFDAVVTEIDDGDTIKIECPDGHVETVRLDGVHAAESNTPLGKIATELVESLLSVGDTVRVEYNPDNPRGYYQRLLASIFKDGVLINTAVEGGVLQIYSSPTHAGIYFEGYEDYGPVGVTGRAIGSKTYGFVPPGTYTPIIKFPGYYDKKIAPVTIDRGEKLIVPGTVYLLKKPLVAPPVEVPPPEEVVPPVEVPPVEVPPPEEVVPPVEPVPPEVVPAPPEIIEEGELPPGTFQVSVVKVVSGNLIRVKFPDGHVEDVKLQLVDVAHPDTALGRIALESLEKKIKPGDTVILSYNEKYPRGKLGELIVTVIKEGRVVNSEVMGGAIKIYSKPSHAAVYFKGYEQYGHVGVTGLKIGSSTLGYIPPGTYTPIIKYRGHFDRELDPVTVSHREYEIVPETVELVEKEAIEDIEGIEELAPGKARVWITTDEALERARVYINGKYIHKLAPITAKDPTRFQYYDPGEYTVGLVEKGEDYDRSVKITVKAGERWVVHFTLETIKFYVNGEEITPLG